MPNKDDFIKALLSEDEDTILTAANAVIQANNLGYTVEENEVINLACSRLPESRKKRIVGYLKFVDIALKVIGNFVEGAKCKCNVYASWPKFYPENEVKIGLLEMTKPVQINQDTRSSDYFCKCKHCGIKWEITTDSGYHFTTYTWRKN